MIRKYIKIFNELSDTESYLLIRFYPEQSWYIGKVHLLTGAETYIIHNVYAIVCCETLLARFNDLPNWSY